MAKFALARLGLGIAALIFGLIAFILHIAFSARETITAHGLPRGEHINGAIAGYGLSGIILLLFCTCIDLAIQTFGWRKYISFWWMFELFGFFLLLLTTGAMSTVDLVKPLDRATLAFDIIFGVIVLGTMMFDDPIVQADKSYNGDGLKMLQYISYSESSSVDTKNYRLDGFLGCLVTQLEATGINKIVQVMLTFIIPVMGFITFILSCVNAHNGRAQQDGFGITGTMLVVASSVLGIWRWFSYRSSPEWLLEWQLLTLLGFYFVSLAVGAWMVPGDLVNLDTAVLVLDTLIVLALLLRLLTTLESTNDYEQIGSSSNSGETTKINQQAQPPAMPEAINATTGEPTDQAQPIDP